MQNTQGQQKRTVITSRTEITTLLVFRTEISHPNDAFCPAEKRMRMKELRLYKMRADFKAYYKYQKSLCIRPTTRKKGMEERSKQLPGPPPISTRFLLPPSLPPVSLLHTLFITADFPLATAILFHPRLPSRSFTRGLPRELPVIFRAFTPQLKFLHCHFCSQSSTNLSNLHLQQTID